MAAGSGQSTDSRKAKSQLPIPTLGAMLRPSPGECTRSTSGMLSRSGTTSAEEQLSSNCRRSMPKAETRARCQLLYPALACSTCSKIGALRKVVKSLHVSA
eukprot:1142638-Pelagomonas_calceolata.AAC.2